MRRLLNLHLMGLLAVISITTIASAQEYTLTQIPTPSGTTNLYTAAINKSGQVTGNTDQTGVFFYSQGVTENLLFVPGFYSTLGEGINDSGAITGMGSLFGWTVAFLDLDHSQYPNSLLPGLDSGATQGYISSTNVYAQSVNNAGQITGGADAADGYLHAFLYSSSEIKDLGVLPNGHFSRGWSINQAGDIAGVGDTESGEHAFVYSAGKLHDIGVLRGGTQSGATAISDCGQVTGSSDGREARAHAFFYSGGRMNDLGVLPRMTRSYGTAINNYGEVVGASDDGRGTQHAFVYSNGRMQDLNDVLEKKSKWTLLKATGINDAGQIAVTGRDASGVSYGFVLTPVHANHGGSKSCSATE